MPQPVRHSQMAIDFLYYFRDAQRVLIGFLEAIGFQFYYLSYRR